MIRIDWFGILVIFLFSSICNPSMADSFDFKFGKNKWIKHSNGAVNIDNITHIKGKISYTVTYDSDNSEDFNKKYGGNLTDENLKKNIPWFEFSSVKDMQFYKLNIEAYLMLDMFKLQLFKSDTFIKLPPKIPEGADSEVVSSGFKLFTEKLDDEEKEKLITEKDYKLIKKELEQSLEYYNNIINN